MLTLVVKPQWVCYNLVESSHQRKCEYVWLSWQNGDVSHLETSDEITTHEECVQPLYSVKLS
jgi:hypothetical protein